jgi:hypothetical protein
MRPADTKALTQKIRDLTRQAKQNLVADYITGVPGEDLDIIEEAFRYFKENDIECRNYQLKFYPNTKLPAMKMDLSGHDLVPITGDLAPELEAYAVVPKNPNPRAAKLDNFIRQASAEVIGMRPVRIGKYYIDDSKKARELIDKTIPGNSDIPDRVKAAMILALGEMLKPTKKTKGVMDLDPTAMMRTVILAGSDAPPMVLAMQAKLRDQIGTSKFEKLHSLYKNTGL